MATARILVVEDEGIVALDIKHRLEGLGYAVPAIAFAGEEAINTAAEIHPDLVLMDIQLKGKMDGVEAAEQIRARFDIPVIYLTAYADEKTLQRAKITEPFGYILKPFEEQELSINIEVALYKHQMERRLRDSETRLRTTFESALDGMFVTDRQGRYVDVNPAGCQMFGYTQEEILSSDVGLLLFPEDVAGALAEAHRHWREDAFIPAGRMRRKDGSEVWVEMTFAPFRVSEKELALAVKRDITARKRAEEALQKIHAELERRVAERTAELSRVNVELRLEITERERAEAALQKLYEELEQRIAERTRELATLYDVTAVASESLDLKVILEHSLRRVQETLPCRAGAIHLLDQVEKVLHLAVQQGIPPDLVAQLDPLPVDSGPVSYMLEQGEPVVIADLATDPRAPRLAGAGSFQVYIGAPMRARGRALGVLSIFGAADQQFSTEDVALLASVADHVGVAVENAQLRQQAEQAATLEERERLARELHDSVTQSLFSLTLFAEAARGLAESGRLDQIKQPLSDIGTTTRQALKDMRLLLYELRPAALEEEGLVGALRRRLDAVEKRAGVEGRVLTDTWLELPTAVEDELYHIAQEALNNALQHAGATSVTVHLHTEGEYVILEISDNGVGFDLDVARNHGGMGLTNMRKRAEKLGGTLTIFTQPGQGTRVQVKLPIADCRLPTDD